MIKSIRFENFYSFKDITVELHHKENILIGINGSGKSNFLKALRLLKEGVSNSALHALIVDKWGGFENICFSSGDEQRDSQLVVLEYCIDAGVLKNFGYQFLDDVYYRILIHSIPGTSNYYLTERLYFSRAEQPGRSDLNLIDFNNGRGRVFGKEFFPDEADENKGFYETRLMEYPEHNPQELVLSTITDPERFPYQYAIKQAMSEILVYDYFNTTPYSRIRKPMAPTSEKRLLPDGSNLPQILNTLNINFKQSFKQILTKLNDVNEQYSDIDFNFIGGNIELMLEEKKLGTAIHVTNISDGTLRFLCLLSILYNPEKGKLICIDEPEIGLHPDMILTIAEAVQESSSTSQLVIATHSENILNPFKLKHIRVFEKNEKNETIVNSYSERDFEGWYEEYVPVGRRWRQGDLGGNRW